MGALWDESFALVLIFYVFLLLSALTVMNMLIGVLCEVVSAVAAAEKESLSVNYVKDKLHHILNRTGLDEDGDGEVSKRKLQKLLEFPEACKALDEVGVDVYSLVDSPRRESPSEGGRGTSKSKSCYFHFRHHRRLALARKMATPHGCRIHLQTCPRARGRAC